VLIRGVSGPGYGHRLETLLGVADFSSPGRSRWKLDQELRVPIKCDRARCGRRSGTAKPHHGLSIAAWRADVADTRQGLGDLPSDVAPEAGDITRRLENITKPLRETATRTRPPPENCGPSGHGDLRV
jgi:hypothetical protein